MEATNSALVLPSTEAPTELSDIHDIRTLVEVPSSWDWLWWVLVALLTAALAYWAYTYWKKRRKTTAEAPAKPREPAHERARRRLEAALQHLHDPDQFCVLVSDAARDYLEDRFDLHAPDRTTEEFLEEVRESDILTPDQKQSLAGFLNECDMVKFAKSEPEAYELQRLQEAALQLVAETEPTFLEEPDSPAQ